MSRSNGHDQEQFTAALVTLIIEVRRMLTEFPLMGDAFLDQLITLVREVRKQLHQTLD